VPDRDFNPKDGNLTLVMNEFFDKLCSYGFDRNEMKILALVIRESWGFKRPWAPLKWKYILKITKLSDSSLRLARTKLILRNVIHIDKNKRPTQYKINSKLSTWILEKDLPLKRRVKSNLQQSTAVNNLQQPTAVFTAAHRCKLQQPTAVSSSRKKPLKKPFKETSKKNGAHEWPADFSLNEKMKKYALARSIAPEKINAFFQDFKDWADSKGAKYKNWEAAFRTRVNKAPQYGRQFLTELGRKGDLHKQLQERGQQWLAKKMREDTQDS